MPPRGVHLATAARALLLRNELAHDDFRRTLLRVAPSQRDAWLDLVLGIDDVPDDGPQLPRGCVPYLPCSVNAVLKMIQHARVTSHDVFVDIGSGLGRAALLTHLLTGAGAIGIEIQPHLVRAARALSSRWNRPRCAVVAGDAASLTGHIAIGSVFFLYCPFAGARLAKVLDDLEPIAEARPIRICSVDLPLPERPWLARTALPFEDVAVYQSTRCARASG